MERGRYSDFDMAEQAQQSFMCEKYCDHCSDGGFSYMSIVGRVSGQDFLTVFSVVIAFYFGTQSQRLNEKLTGSAADGKQASKDTAQ